jgi:hypothetical protein
MYEQSTNSRPEAPDDERGWSRQLRRDRRAALSTMEENAALPGPGAAASGGAVAAKAPSGGGGRFGGFVRGAALSGMMAGGIGGSAPASAAGEDDGSGDAESNDDGGGSQMASAGEAGPRGGRPSGPVTGAAVKEAVRGAQAAKVKGAGAAALATKVLGEDKVADLANAVIAEFTDPLGRMLYWTPLIWMYGTFFLGAFLVLPLQWGYMLLGWVGIPKFNASILKVFILLVNSAIFLTIVLVLMAIIVGIAQGAACSHNVFCVIKLLKDYGSYFF